MTSTSPPCPILAPRSPVNHPPRCERPTCKRFSGSGRTLWKSLLRLWRSLLYTPAWCCSFGRAVSCDPGRRAETRQWSRGDRLYRDRHGQEPGGSWGEVGVKVHLGMLEETRPRSWELCGPLEASAASCHRLYVLLRFYSGLSRGGDLASHLGS